MSESEYYFCPHCGFHMQPYHIVNETTKLLTIHCKNCGKEFGHIKMNGYFEQKEEND